MREKKKKLFPTFIYLYSFICHDKMGQSEFTTCEMCPLRFSLPFCVSDYLASLSLISFRRCVWLTYFVFHFMFACVQFYLFVLFQIKWEYLLFSVLFLVARKKNKLKEISLNRVACIRSENAGARDHIEVIKPRAHDYVTDNNVDKWKKRWKVRKKSRKWNGIHEFFRVLSKKKKLQRTFVDLITRR